MCAEFRRAARSLTQLYEDALRPAGLRGTQFTILQVLIRVGEITQGQLGHILAIDSTTLTRTLAIMGRHGWIKKRRGADRREWRIALSPRGKATYQHALPLWEGVQERMRHTLGEAQWKQLLALAKIVTRQAIEHQANERQANEQGDPT
jgi:DNA-binding MarR family transcriptional regulator